MIFYAILYNFLIIICEIQGMQEKSIISLKLLLNILQTMVHITGSHAYKLCIFQNILQHIVVDSRK